MVKLSTSNYVFHRILLQDLSATQILREKHHNKGVVVKQTQIGKLTEFLIIFKNPYNKQTSFGK